MTAYHFASGGTSPRGVLDRIEYAEHGTPWMLSPEIGRVCCGGSFDDTFGVLWVLWIIQHAFDSI